MEAQHLDWQFHLFSYLGLPTQSPLEFPLALPLTQLIVEKEKRLSWWDSWMGDWYLPSEEFYFREEQMLLFIRRHTTKAIMAIKGSKRLNGEDLLQLGPTPG